MTIDQVALSILSAGISAGFTAGTFVTGLRSKFTILHSQHEDITRRMDRIEDRLDRVLNGRYPPVR